MQTLTTAQEPVAVQVRYVDPPLLKKKIALVGFADSTRMLAPFDDPDYEIWTLNMHAGLPRVDRRFEQHDRATIDAEDRDLKGAYLDMLRAERTPIYMLDVQPDIPTSVRFPIEALVGMLGPLCGKIRDGYCESTFSYMLGHAIRLLRERRADPNVPEDGEIIGIYGIDLTLNEEYAYQRPNAEMYCGFAMGCGIAIYIPPDSALFSSAGGGLYGYQAGEKWQVLNELRTYCDERLAELNAEFQAVKKTQDLEVTKMQILDGLKQQTVWQRSIIMHLLRGGSITDKQSKGHKK